ncbi:hypothetical protein ACWIUD_08020 [Helicobacter sp. 23-1044]
MVASLRSQNEVSFSKSCGLPREFAFAHSLAMTKWRQILRFSRILQNLIYGLPREFAFAHSLAMTKWRTRFCESQNLNEKFYINRRICPKSRTQIAESKTQRANFHTLISKIPSSP